MRERTVFLLLRLGLHLGSYLPLLREFLAPRRSFSAVSLTSTISQQRQTGSDLANCGGIGKVCNPDSSLGAMCSGGSCFATACVLGYKLVNGACINIDLTSDGELSHSLPHDPS